MAPLPQTKQQQGRSNRRRGAVAEREIVNKHLELGIDAKRVPLSGAARGFKDDVEIPGVGRGEVKARKTGGGFALLERWLGAADVLFLRRNRAEPLVVLPWATYARLLKGGKE